MTPDELETLYNLLLAFLDREELGQVCKSEIYDALRAVFAALRSKLNT